MHETDRYPYTDEERSTIGTLVHAVRQAMIDRRNAERPGAQQARDRRSAQREVEAERVKVKEEARQRVPKQAYALSLKDLNVPTKVHTNLENNNLQNVGEIMERLSVGDEELLVLHGIGIKALRDIKNAVQELELTFQDSDAEEEQAPEETEVGELVQTVTEVESEIVEDEPSEEESTVQVEELEQPEVETQPESKVELEPVVEPEIEADFDIESFTEVVEDFSAFEEEEELVPEGDTLGETDNTSDRKEKRRKQRAVFFDDESGETYVRRKRRKGNEAWDEYGDDF